MKNETIFKLIDEAKQEFDPLNYVKLDEFIVYLKQKFINHGDELNERND